MAKKNKPEGKKYSYMDTYGDLVTLLLCFFVLLFSMSTVEEVKYNAFVEALQNRFGGAQTDKSFPTELEEDEGSQIGKDNTTGDQMEQNETLPQDFTQLHEAISRYVEENGMEGEVTVEMSENGTVFLRMSDNLLFDGNSANLKQEVLSFLDFLGECFMAVEKQVLQVNFKGHTASVQGSGVDDWILSAERAGGVASYISNTGGFNRFKINFSGYGRNYPIADNQVPEGRAKNRRVDIIVLSNESKNLESALADAMRVYFPGDTTEFFEGEANDIPDNLVDGVAPTGEGAGALDALTEEQRQALNEAVAPAEGEPG